MNPPLIKDAQQALDLVTQVCEQAPMTGPQRRMIEASLATLSAAIQPPAPPAPTPAAPAPAP